MSDQIPIVIATLEHHGDDAWLYMSGERLEVVSIEYDAVMDVWNTISGRQLKINLRGDNEPFIAGLIMLTEETVACDHLRYKLGWPAGNIAQ